MSEKQRRDKDKERLRELYSAIEPARNDDIAREAVAIAHRWLIKAENQSKQINNLEKRYKRYAEKIRNENQELVVDGYPDGFADGYKTERMERNRTDGEWIKQNPNVDTEECSVCGFNILSEELETPFCPWCGAEMKVGVIKI